MQRQQQTQQQRYGGSQLCPRTACRLSDGPTYRYHRNISATTILSRVPESNSYALLFLLFQD